MKLNLLGRGVLKEMSRLEVDVKSIQKLIRSRVVKARQRLGQFEAQAEKRVTELVRRGLKSKTEGKQQFDRLIKDVR